MGNWMIVSRHVAPLVDSGAVPGLVVGLYREGQASYFAFGSLSYDANESPDENTFFETGSVGKLYTALLLVEADRRGEVLLEEPLTQFEVYRRKAGGLVDEPILLWHLSAHLSGLPREPDDLDDSQPNPYAEYGTSRLWAFLARASLVHPPGTADNYSNLGVGLLGTLLEEATGLRYAEQIRSRIAQPLGLSDTTSELHGEQSTRLAPPHALGMESISWPADDALAASGCLRSTAADTLRFVRLFLSPPEAPIGQSIIRMMEPRYRFEGGGAIALGWHIMQDGTYWHNGATGGYHTFVAFNRARDLAVVILANDVSPRVSEAGFCLTEALLGMSDEPIDLPVPATLSAADMIRLIGRYCDPESERGITITRNGNRLFAQLTGQAAFPIVPESETLFRFRAVEASLRFDLTDSNVATGLTLLQDGSQWALQRE